MEPASRNIGHENIENAHVKENIEGPITHLTDDLTVLFLSHLKDDADISSSLLVSKAWSEKMVNAQTHLAIIPINQMLDVIIRNLAGDKYIGLRNELSQLKGGKIFDSQNLLELKVSFLTKECEIMKVLTKLSPEEFSDLKSKILENLDERLKIPLLKYFNLYEPCKHFFEIHEIKDEQVRKNEYSFIGHIFLSQGQTEMFCKLLNLEQAMPNREKCSVLIDLFSKSMQMKDTGSEGIKTLSQISKFNREDLPPEFNSQVLKLSELLLKEGDLRNCLKASTFLDDDPISLKKRQSLMVHDCFEQFRSDADHSKFDVKKFEDALEAAHQHVPEFDKQIMIKEFSKRLENNNSLNEAFALSKLMDNISEEPKLLFDLSTEHAKTGYNKIMSGDMLGFEYLVEASKLAHTIKIEPYQSKSLAFISDLIKPAIITCVESGKFVLADKIANLESNEETKSKLLAAIENVKLANQDLSESDSDSEEGPQPDEEW